MSVPLRVAALRVLEPLLHVSHIAVILFSALGWLFAYTRQLHLVLQALVLFSWYGLGSFKGWTYCVLTDVHWRVRQALDRTVPTTSYVKFLVDRLTGRDSDVNAVNKATVTVFFVTTALSLLLFLGDRVQAG
jgi:hypothetical protein